MSKAKSLFILISWMLTFFLWTVLCYGGFEYNSEGKRDPFMPLAGVSGSSPVSGIKGISSISDVKFQGVVIGSGGGKQVILNGELIAEGETIGEVSMLKISDNEVLIKIRDKEHSVKLYE